MVGGFSPLTPPARQRRNGPLVACGLAFLLLGLLALPSVHAEEYEGPGHTGMVPVGDGGVLATHAPLAGQGVTHIPLEGVPEQVCRIVLDENGTYARSLLVWPHGNETAYIAAQVGERDVPYRVVSHWESDINGACTVEVTVDGTIWHDPRGRPFHAVFWKERMVTYDITPGTWNTVEAFIQNNGTLEETVNVSLEHMRDEWETRNVTGVVDRRIGPEESIRIGFDLYMPKNERTGTKLLLFHATGEKSGWADRATIMMRVEGTDNALGSGDEPEENDTLDPRRYRDPPSGTGSQSGQIPAPGVLLALLAVMSLLGRLRARRPTDGGD